MEYFGGVLFIFYIDDVWRTREEGNLRQQVFAWTRQVRLLLGKDRHSWASPHARSKVGGSQHRIQGRRSGLAGPKATADRSNGDDVTARLRPECSRPRLTFSQRKFVVLTLLAFPSMCGNIQPVPRRHRLDWRLETGRRYDRRAAAAGLTKCFTNLGLV